MLAAHVIAAGLTVLVLRRGEALVLAIAERVVAVVCPPPAAHGPCRRRPASVSPSRRCSGR